MVRGILIAVGTLSLGLGVVGIFLPLLPTTPFLLLTAACYARSSEKFYSLLMNNRWFGAYIKNYRERRGIALKIKVLSLSLLWVTILSSAIFAVSHPLVRVLLILIAAAVTVHILSVTTLRD
jgi:hypothetical protein